MGGSKKGTSYKFDDKIHELIDELQKELGATSKAEVVRIALKELRKSLKGRSQEIELLTEIRDLLKEKS